MQTLFGDLCIGKTFVHDNYMNSKAIASCTLGDSTDLQASQTTHDTSDDELSQDEVNPRRIHNPARSEGLLGLDRPEPVSASGPPLTVSNAAVSMSRERFSVAALDECSAPLHRSKDTLDTARDPLVPMLVGRSLSDRRQSPLRTPCNGPEASMLEPCRTARELAKLHEQDGRQVPAPKVIGLASDVSDGDSASFHTPTHRVMMALSPGSSSQSQRRRAISDLVAKARQKRIRCSGESEELDVADNPDTSGLRELETGSPNILQLIALQGHQPGRWEVDVIDSSKLFRRTYDYEDDVFRCTICHWEVWGPSGDADYCDHCLAGKKDWDDARNRGIPPPNVIFDELAEGSNLDGLGALFKYFDRMRKDGETDNDTESESELGSDEDAYELNSMIDDSENPARYAVESETELPFDSEANDANYKTLYTEKCDELDRIKAKLAVLQKKYEDDSGLGDSSLPRHEKGMMMMIERQPEGPRPHEPVLSQKDSQIDSQSNASQVSTPRDDDVVPSTSSSPITTWDAVSLVSVGNHTLPEVVL